MALIDSYSESNTSQEGTFIFYTGQITRWGQTFSNPSSFVLGSVKFFIHKTGSPTGNIYVKIYEHTGTFGSTGKPTGSALATSDPVDISTLSSTYEDYQLKTFNFSGANKITLNASTNYCISMEWNDASGNSSNKLMFGADATSPTHAGNSFYYNTVWNSYATYDLPFYIYGYDTLTKTITAKSRIKLQNIIKTVQSKSRVKKTNLVKSVQAKSRLKLLNKSQTIIARSRIKKINTTKSITVKSRIKKTNTKTAQTKARVKNTNLVKTITAKSDIKKSGIVKTITAKSSIGNQKVATISSKATLKKTGVQRSIIAKGRIKKIHQDIIQAKSAIAGQYKAATIQSRGRIKRIDFTSFISSKATISGPHSSTVTAKSNIWGFRAGFVQMRSYDDHYPEVLLEGRILDK